MLGYTPMFSQIVDSSLWVEPPHVRVLFMTLLAIKDWDHIARIPDHHLPGKAKLTDDEVLDGLRILSSPDQKCKIPQPYDGRRIERVAEGWLILNGEKYQEIMRRLNLKAKWARNKRVQREKKAVEQVIRSVAPLPKPREPVPNNGDAPY